jgi:hypothetical protein
MACCSTFGRPCHREDLEEFAVSLDALSLNEPEELRPVGAELLVQIAKAKRIEIVLVDSLDSDDYRVGIAVLDQPDASPLLRVILSDKPGPVPSDLIGVWIRRERWSASLRPC